MSLSRLIARIVMVPIGLFLAIMAASIFLGFALNSMAPSPGMYHDPAAENMFAIFSGFVLAFPLGHFAFYPAILGLIIAEIFSWRSIWVYLAYGLVLSFFITHSPGEPVDAMAIAIDIRAMAAGLIGGFVYWLIAGRGAGVVKRSLDNKPKSL
ncbi:hypothetical protein [uncultured Cohaesibacter sp.]|uniref:hypothetical protein n=1 Tax=uncultured Cohaesibacter sp. TaxID=1002546 RepID=UPI002AA649D2|nr:hypothetical protein [uncultured Cohaesibacter sp.]